MDMWRARWNEDLKMWEVFMSFEHGDSVDSRHGTRADAQARADFLNKARVVF